MIKIILFDVDGVLAIGENFTKTMSVEHGISLEMLLPFFRGRFIACRNGQADLKTELQPYLVQWRWPYSVEAFLRYWFEKEHVIDEALVAYIQRLRQQGIPCYLATNQEKYRTTYILEQMGFADKFDGMFSSAYIGCGKEHSAFFAHILHKMAGIQANEILFWDDSPGNLEVARQVGIQAEHYTNFAAFQVRMQHYFPLA